ncbi:uncharacterized protein METZ01_LOCUS453107 [marine metagenome]|uniref:Uncharacterized protein n=1 Tax=marine metagenome TaxID=408172 RepID=A0A382ZXX6_9ZZZZ
MNLGRRLLSVVVVIILTERRFNCYSDIKRDEELAESVGLSQTADTA